MTQEASPSAASQSLRRHRELLDELLTLVREESRILSQGAGSFAPDFLDRKRTLLGQLGESLDAVRAAQGAGTSGKEIAGQVAAAKSRVLQILEIENENERLLMKQSLARSTGPKPAHPVAADILKRIYR